jgi:hypothetical protein
MNKNLKLQVNFGNSGKIKPIRNPARTFSLQVRSPRRIIFLIHSKKQFPAIKSEGLIFRETDYILNGKQPFPECCMNVVENKQDG